MDCGDARDQRMCLIVRAILLVLVVLLGSCSLAQEDHSRLVERQNVAADEVSRAIEYFLALSQEADPTTSEEWTRIFAESAIRTGRLRTAYDEWSDRMDEVIVADAVPEGHSIADVREWQHVLGEWVAGMEEQHRLTAECFNDGSMDEDCFLEVLTEHAQEWYELGERVNAVRVRLDQGL